jgi:hypothetical protein
MKALCPLAAVFILGLWATAARGDGGTMMLHQDSVMVQDRSSGDVLLDPAVDLTVAPEAANESPQTVRLTRGQASNRLLQAATVQFPQAGKWRLTLLVSCGGEAVRLGTECTVEPDRSRALLVWFYVLLPAGIILLFVLHQGLKTRQRKAR